MIWEFEVGSLEKCIVIHGLPAEIEAGTNPIELLKATVVNYQENLEFQLGTDMNMARSLAASACMKRGKPLTVAEMKTLVDKLLPVKPHLPVLQAIRPLCHDLEDIKNNLNSSNGLHWQMWLNLLIINVLVYLTFKLFCPNSIYSLILPYFPSIVNCSRPFSDCAPACSTTIPMAFATYCSIWWPCILLALSLNTLLDQTIFISLPVGRATQWYFSPFPVRWTGGRGFWCYQRGNDFYERSMYPNLKMMVFPFPLRSGPSYWWACFWRLIYFQVLPILQLALPILLTWGDAMGAFWLTIGDSAMWDDDDEC